MEFTRPEQEFGANTDPSEAPLAGPSESWDSLLRLASDALPAMIWVAGADGKCRWVNQRYQDFTGRTLEHSLGQRWMEVIHPEDIERLLGARRAATEKRQAFQAEFRLLRADGQYRWVLSHGAPCFASSGELCGYAGQMVDITSRKQAEHELRWMSHAVEQSPASVVITDLQGNIEYVNPKFTALTGYTFEEALGKTPRILKGGEMSAEEYTTLWQTIASGGNWRGELHNKKKNGELYWELASICPIRDPAGKPTHYIAVKEDITGRKRIEAALRASEERFRIAAANASGRIYEWHLNTDEVRVWAEDGDPFQVHSYDDWERRIHPGDHDRVVAAVRQCVVSGLPYRDEYRVLAPDGAVLYYSDRAEPLCDETGTPCRWIGVVRDITARKRAEEVRAQLASIVQCSQDAILAINPQGSIISWNPAAEKLYGYRAEEILGYSPAMLVTADRQEEAGRNIAAALRGDIVPPYEARNVRRDGSTFPVSVTASPLRNGGGKIIGISAIARDISEQQRAQEALRESEQRYRELVEDAADIIVTFDLEGTLTSVNRAGELISGYDRKELLRMTLWQLAAPQSQAPMREAIAAWLGGAPSVPQEIEIIARDGCRIPVEARGVLLFEGGMPVGVQAIARDVRQRHRNEQLSRDRREVLKMLALNQPLHTVLRQLVEMVEHYHPGTSACISLEGSCRGADCETSRNTALECGWSGGVAVPIRSANGALLGGIEIHCELRPIAEAELAFLEEQAKLAALALDHRQLNDRLAFQALHDPLTGLPNRALLEDRLGQAIALARRQDKMVAVIYLDLDRFKLVNDTLGHAAGDALLQEVSKRLAGAARESDTLARMGGDEFVSVCFGFDQVEDAEPMGAQFVAAMQQPFHVNGHELYLSLSAGLSLFPRDGGDACSLLKNADMAMYTAKNGGKNRFQSYVPSMRSAAGGIFEFEANLHQAIDRGELLLHYQPQFDLTAGKLAGVEGLVRWNHPERGLVMPGRFIPLAEECGLIMPIGAWVLDEACRQHQMWRQAGYPPVRIAVNVSALQFACSNLSAKVAAALEKYHVEPRYLELEITEGVLIRDVGDSARQLAALRELGVSVAIDDFGVGYSSLSYLQKLPIDNLKIDQCFVKGVGAPDSTRPLVQAVIGLAHGLKLTATAEGVETEVQLDALRTLGCDQVQGYLLGRPVPAARCEEFLAQRKLPACPPEAWPELRVA